MSSLPEQEHNSGNRDRGAFEGTVLTELSWIKHSLTVIQGTCLECGRRVQRCEDHVDQSGQIAAKVEKLDERIRGCENSIGQAKAVGGILGAISGILVSVGMKLWKLGD